MDENQFVLLKNFVSLHWIIRNIDTIFAKGRKVSEKIISGFRKYNMDVSDVPYYMDDKFV